MIFIFDLLMILFFDFENTVGAKWYTAQVVHCRTLLITFVNVVAVCPDTNQALALDESQRRKKNKVSIKW